MLIVIFHKIKKYNICAKSIFNPTLNWIGNSQAREAAVTWHPDIKSQPIKTKTTENIKY